MDDVLADMTKAGMQAKHTLLAAHSLGGVMSQIYVSSNPHKAEALILMGATLLRKYRNPSWPVPTLTIDGELDGQLHITRQAEAYYHQVEHAANATAAAMGNPVVILEGLSHWSFGSGPASSTILKNDLKPEVSEADGHRAIAEVVNNFVSMRLGSTPTTRTDALAAMKVSLAHTGTLLAPLIEAMVLEGYHHFQVPCDSDYPTNPTCQYPKYPDHSLGIEHGAPSPPLPSDCTCGSEWVMTRAQPMMASLPANVTLTAKDAFHDVSQTTPFHLPHIFEPKPGTACPSLEECHIESTTVTMPIYDFRDELDTGLWPVTATEFRTKLKSREAYQQSAGLQNVDFDATDKNNVKTCRDINQAAYDWALSKAGRRTVERFERVGQQLEFGDDIWSGIGLTGPTWIKNALKFKASDDKKTVTVTAPYFATGNSDLGDRIFLDTVGYHYCKLLSPARAMEWLYVDGLRQFDALRVGYKQPPDALWLNNTCPDITKFRSKDIRNSFDPKKLEGKWYEQVYTDLAQVGASCQTLDVSYAQDTGEVSMDFAVKYGIIPFTITENYTPVPGSLDVQGYYNKNAAMPGGSLLTLPTVVVDASESEDGSTYETMTLFSCAADPHGIAYVSELVFATRGKSISAAERSSLEATAHALGVPFKSSDLTLVDHSGC